MPRLSRLLATSLAAFYTICSTLTAHADEAESSALITKINAGTRANIEETADNISDYVYLLNEDKKTPQECVETLLAFCRVNSTNNQFQQGAVFYLHWLVALKGFSVIDVDSMKLLHQVLSTFVHSSPQNISSESAKMLLKLGGEVLKVETQTRELQEIKVLTLWQLALLAQNDKTYGRKLGTFALEQMAEFGATPESERRDAIFRVLYSYAAEQPRSKADGDLLFRDAIAVGKILKKTNNKYDFQHVDSVYNQLLWRCTSVEALAAQEELAKEARRLKVDEKTLDTILLQLACAYLRANKPNKAEELLSQEIQKPNPMEKLLLIECLRRQRKYVHAETLAKQVAKTQFSFQIRYPSLYVALANALCAQLLIDQKNYSSALPLLICADTWFSNGIAHDNSEVREFAYLEDLIPDEVTVLSNLALVYDKLSRKTDAQRIRQTLERVQRERRASLLSVERDALNNAALAGHDSDKTIWQAKRFVEVNIGLEKDPKKCAEGILDYAETLIKQGKPKSAQVCLDAFEHSDLVEKNNNPDMRVRLSVDRILIAEERGDLDSARILLKELPKDTALKQLNDQLRICEAEARLALMSGEFHLAESKSVLLEKALENTSPKPDKNYFESQRDKFVKEHAEGLLDRVQTLNHNQKYEQAAKIARLLLISAQNQFDRAGVDSAAHLSLAYARTGHKGLAQALEYEATYRNRASYPLPPSRYFADAKETLAILSEMNNNPIRARRYRAEAQEILDQMQKKQQSTP